MNTVLLRDNRVRIIGQVTVYDNGDKMLYDERHNILGTYRKTINMTKDFYGNIVGYGDVLTMLLR